ncbi:MAG: preprotein translocase subunit YajC [Acutalibacteraceae bacterium]|nr:preprotein translocase subunit YajC [Acutalibacteraceae bacterium]
MDFSAITFQLLANTPSGSQGGGSTTVWMVVLLLFFVVYMFFISRRDKKQKKEEAAMRDSMKVGDEVLTIGGIMGRVVSVKDDSVVIETGADRNKIRFTKTAIATNVSADNRVKEAKAAQEAAKQAAKKQKKAGSSEKKPEKVDKK